jgi:RNA methyltransferase, TrmH family
MTDRRPGDPAGSRAELTDVRSPQVRAARRLLKRSFREQDRAFLAEGAQAVREALVEAASSANAASAAGPRVRQLFVTADARARYPELLNRAAELGVPIQQASGHVLSELSDTVTPQGLVAVCAVLDVPLATALAALAGELAAGGRAADAGPGLVVLLAAIRDPGNAGTVLRTADAAGAAAVVFSESSVDPYNGKCVRASAGSLFHLPVVVGAPVLATIDALRAAGLQVLAADGGPDAESLDDLEHAGGLARPTAWIFGNEAWGLPAEVRAAADLLVRVPIHGRAESLNLAAAAAVCLYSSARAQRAAAR